MQYRPSRSRCKGPAWQWCWRPLFRRRLGLWLRYLWPGIGQSWTHDEETAHVLVYEEGFSLYEAVAFVDKWGRVGHGGGDNASRARVCGRETKAVKEQGSG